MIINFGDTSVRNYSKGISKGVLYTPTGAVAWPGLVSFKESKSGGVTSERYVEGRKFYTEQGPTFSSGEIKCLTYPEELEHHLGNASVKSGFYASNQFASRVGITFQKRIENTVTGLIGSVYYFIYNALPVMNDTNSTTINNSAEVEPFTITLDLIPEPLAGYFPTAVYSFNTTKAGVAATERLKEALYGTYLTDPYLPKPEEIMGFITEDPTALTAVVTE